ncbi:hypothetical protein ACI2KS_10780 [Pseudomonas sp. NPDC087358]|uniref:hypothetical protein n=1 Tax=Pseudomonas sp. NPDC087358 TaxID=3364439 RepID=UPI003851199A
MASLIVTKASGELLFDTARICHGLVKSGHMTYIETWPRQYLRSANLDPNHGGNWNPSFREGDAMYGFTLDAAVSPIVFIVGKGCLNGTRRSGSSITFLYTGGDAGTRYYCFDLMADNIPGGPYLKTYTDTGVITFNSLQPPLNIVAAVRAPPAPDNDRYGRKVVTYLGGRHEKIRYQTATVDTQLHCVVDIGLGNGNFAACLPWARTASLIETATVGAGGLVSQYSVSEGVYGRAGGISFMFAPAGASPEAFPGGTAYSIPASYQNLPADRLPEALVISTSHLPFPYR